MGIVTFRKQMLAGIMSITMVAASVIGNTCFTEDGRNAVFASTKMTQEDLAQQNENYDNFEPKNALMDVGDKIYVQHDENHKDVYDLVKNESGDTVVYECILPTFTANKVWTTDGDFITNIAMNANGTCSPYSATAPQNYIPVQPGEIYYIRTYGAGFVKIPDTQQFVKYAPVLFLDDNDKVVADMLFNSLSASKAGVIITVPDNATKLHITMFGNQSFTLEKQIVLSEKEFEQIEANKKTFLENIDRNYEVYKEDRTVYQKPDKAYITFVNDDTRTGMDQYADLFLSKNIPLVLATVPELLIENASNQKETRLEVARRVVDAGGEILAHNGGVLTEEKLSDYNEMYAVFVKSKQIFNQYGLDVNGAILGGGVGMVTGREETEKWCSSIYSYADLYGVEYEHKMLALDSVYYHRRGGLGNYKSDFEALKAAVDNAIRDKSWSVFYFHEFSEIDEEVFSQLLDYINSKNENELEVVTYKQMYSRFAKKEQTLKKEMENTPATITFTIDDSQKDAMTVIKPIFDKYGFKASVGVIRDLVLQSTSGKNNWYLTEDDIKAMYEDGWEILAHGLDFATISTGENLFLQPSSTNPVSQSGYTIEQELADSKVYLEGLIGEGNVKGFVIPNLYVLDEYTPLMKKSFSYALGSGSYEADYAHDRTKMANMKSVKLEVEDEAKSVADSIISQIDEAILGGTELNLYCHVTDEYIKQINWSNYDCNVEALEMILQYLYEKHEQGRVNVMVPGEVYVRKAEREPTVIPTVEPTKEPITTSIPTATVTSIPTPTQQLRVTEAIKPTKTPTPKPRKQSQNIAVSKKTQTVVKCKVKDLKKRKQSFSINAKAKTTIAYQVTKGNKKYISVSSTGKVTLKKGCKKGSYKITVTAKENTKYKKATKVITIRVN